MAYSPSTFAGWGTTTPPEEIRDRSPPSPTTRAHDIMTGGMPYVPSLRYHMQPPHLERPRMTADHVLIGPHASSHFSSYQQSRESSKVRGTVKEIADADASTVHSSDSSEGLMLPPLRREQKRHGIVFRPNELVTADEAFGMAQEAEVAEIEEAAEKRTFTHRASSAAGVVVTAGRNVKRKMSSWFRKDSALSGSDEEKLVEDQQDGSASTVATDGLQSAQVDGGSEVHQGRPHSYRPGREAEAEGRRERAHTRASTTSAHPQSYRKNRFSRGAAETPEHLRPKLSDTEVVTQAQLQEMLELHVGEAYQRGRLDERAITSRFAKACGNTTNARDQAVVSDDLRRTITENKLATDRTWRYQEKHLRVVQPASSSRRRHWPFGGGVKKQKECVSSAGTLSENFCRGVQKAGKNPSVPAEEDDPDWPEAARLASDVRMWGIGGAYY
ncbi:hypothetical protein LTR86_005256 [Recurvomyces mirabilis]|nr:hypothetical protein LTR86_005256 [Recurvomyces mirabilis]